MVVDRPLLTLSVPSQPVRRWKDGLVLPVRVGGTKVIGSLQHLALVDGGCAAHSPSGGAMVFDRTPPQSVKGGGVGLEDGEIRAGRRAGGCLVVTTMVTKGKDGDNEDEGRSLPAPPE